MNIVCEPVIPRGGRREIIDHLNSLRRSLNGRLMYVVVVVKDELVDVNKNNH